MALRNIVTVGDPILKRKCRDIEKITPRINTLIDDMIETMREAEGVGIVAPQVGVARKLCIISPEEEVIKVLIDPEILESKGEVESSEGCLSVPGKIGIVKRPEYIKVKYRDIKGREITEEIEGFEAIVASYELDHLKGRLYIEKATNIRNAEDMEEGEEKS